MSHPTDPRPRACPDCDSHDPALSRRDFLKTTAGGIATVTAASAGIVTAGGLAVPGLARAAEPAAKPASETLVAQLYGSLTEQQRKVLCFAFDHPLRQKVDNNWTIVDQHIGQVLNKDQQALVKDIFMGMHSEEYAERVFSQVEHDGGGRGTFYKECAVALFGEPDKSGSAEKGKFEFVLTGRHCTRRCDGNSVEGAAFGGPIFYGHAAEGFNEKPHHPGNAYWFQAVRANEVFKALDGKQRERALRSDPRRERGTETVALDGKRDLHGVPVADLSADQKDLVRKVMADLLAPFRKPDADEAMKLVEAGGFDRLHMAFYKNLDIGDDGVWDVWQVEGPGMIWYFRGSPHVHTWVHIREPAKA